MVWRNLTSTSYVSGVPPPPGWDDVPRTPGLTIFCLVPTTLGIGVALVRSCSGNEAIALLLTVATNMIGVLSMPLYLKLLFLNFDTGGLNLNINIPDLLLKLTLTILVPSILGKVRRRKGGDSIKELINRQLIQDNRLTDTCTKQSAT